MLLRWHWASEMIKPKPVIWGVWVNKSHWSRESPNIIIKSQITTKMCVYFITFAVVTPIYTYQYMHGVVCLGGTGTACSVEYAHSFVIILLSWLTHSSSFFTFFFFSYRLWLLHWHWVNDGCLVTLKCVGNIKRTNTKPCKGRPVCMFLCVDCSYIHLGMTKSLQWGHNGIHGVPNHQPRDCLPYGLFGRR